MRIPTSPALLPSKAQIFLCHTDANDTSPPVRHRSAPAADLQRQRRTLPVCISMVNSRGKNAAIRTRRNGLAPSVLAHPHPPPRTTRTPAARGRATHQKASAGNEDENFWLAAWLFLA